MSILNIKQYLIIGVSALLIGAVSAGIIVWNIRGTEIELIQKDHAIAEAKTQLEASKANTELANLRLSFETRLGDKKDELQKQFETSVDSINQSIASFSKHRLQDPHANSSTRATGTTGSTSSSDGAVASEGVLSAEASQFLFGYSGEADALLERMRTCQQWNTSVEHEYSEYKNQVDAIREDLRKRGILKED